MKRFHYRVLRNYDSYKVKAWYTHGQWAVLYRVYQNKGQGPITLGVTSADMFYNLPLMKIFCPTFHKNCKGNKVETWYTHGQWVDDKGS